MSLFDGPGEARARCRAIDWAATPLGPVSTWPPALVHAVRLVMSNGIPGVVLWGRALTQIYNDAYAGLIAAKHPFAMGRGNEETWPEVWHLNAPIYERVFRGETVTITDAPYPLERRGFTENVWLTISYSPVMHDDDQVGGVYVSMLETTDRVLLGKLQQEREGLIEGLRAERQRLATAFQHAPSFLAVLRGADHRFELVNDAYYQLIGHREVVGRTVAEAIPEAVEQGFIGLLDRVYETREPFVGRELPIQLQRTPDGALEQRYVDFIYLPNVEGNAVTGIIAHGNDVTAVVESRQEVERLLRESEQAARGVDEERSRLADVLDVMNDAHVTIDADWRITRVNRAYTESLGRPASDFVGHDHWTLFPETIGTEVERQYRRVHDERVDAHFSNRYVGQGLDIIVEIDVYPAEGGGISVFWRDVSDREHSNAALIESEQRFRTVQDTSPNGSLLLRPVREGDEVVDFEYEYANPAASRLTNVPLDRIIGNRMLTLFSNSPTEGYFQQVKQVAETGEPFDEELTYRRDGTLLGLHLTIVRAGDLVHVRFADVTQRMLEAKEREQLFEALEAAYAEAQAAELRLRNLYEQAPVSIAVMEGPDLVYTIVSPRYAKSPGNGRELLGKSVLAAFPELDPNGFPAIMRRVYETGIAYRASEVRVMLDDHRNGNLVEHFFDVGYQPLRNGAGRVYAIASVAYDVTEQINARREIERAREAAEHAYAAAESASRAKSEFLAVMSHELRTPLNAIGGYAELIELGIHGPVTDAQRTALSRIQASQRHLLGLINGVLNYSRVEAGAVTYDLVRIPVAEAIAEAESLVAPQLRSKGLGYTWMGCAPTLAMRADREKLQQILLNLLSNAIKFTEARGGSAGRVIVSCDIEESGADERGTTPVMVRIHVRDTGVGIEPEKLKAVFEPFVQVDQRLTRRQEGVGLGLTISRDLARGMHGDLTAESVPGQGSTFTLSLPMA